MSHIKIANHVGTIANPGVRYIRRIGSINPESLYPGSVSLSDEKDHITDSVNIDVMNIEHAEKLIDGLKLAIKLGWLKPKNKRKGV